VPLVELDPPGVRLNHDRRVRQLESAIGRQGFERLERGLGVGSTPLRRHDEAAAGHRTGSPLGSSSVSPGWTISTRVSAATSAAQRRNSSGGSVR